MVRTTSVESNEYSEHVPVVKSTTAIEQSRFLNEFFLVFQVYGKNNYLHQIFEGTYIKFRNVQFFPE